MTETSIISAVFGALISSGLCTAIFKKMVTDALDEAKEKKAQETKDRQRRTELTSQRDAAESRVMFWIVHGIESFEKEEEKHFWNGDLKKAYAELEEVNATIKEFDRQQLAKIYEK